MAMNDSRVPLSLVITVKNERESIDALISSIDVQSDPPDELVIVDGGSSDGTYEALLERLSKFPNAKVLKAPGTNISQGRNHGIRAARYQLVAVTDAGCRLDRDWTAAIRKAFQKDAKLACIYGAVRPEAENAYEECAGVLSLARSFGKRSGHITPSARSMAFRMEAFEEVGGFPENIYTGEDVLFVERIRNLGRPVLYLPEALVFWRPRENLLGIFHQFRSYAVGGVRAGLLGKLYLRPLLWLVLLTAMFVLWVASGLWLFAAGLAVALACFIFYKFIRYILTPTHFPKHYFLAFFWLPAVLVFLHAGQAVGFIEGFLRKLLATDSSRGKGAKIPNP